MSRIFPRKPLPPAVGPLPPVEASAAGGATPPKPSEALPAPPRTGGRALTVVAVGAILVALAALPFFDYDLDRFYAPKELALHLTALVALRSVLKRTRGKVQRWEDGVLVALTALSFVSAVAAVNPWLGLRALAVSTSSAALYVVGRALARDGYRREVVGIVVASAALVAGAAAAQALGVTSDLFSLARAPGGTLGNRNAVAHVCAIALPLVVAAAFGARRTRWVVAALPVLLLLAGLVVVSRSRAAWVACVAVLVVFAVGAWLRRWEAPKARLLMVGGSALLGVGLALALPNALDWKSDNPYRDSLRDIVNAQEGSGRGRILQYQHTMDIARAHPLLGVGPGNWPVVYPDVAPPGDPSLSRATGLAMNPWPSSDLVATVAERGFPVALLLGVFALLVGVSSLLRIRRADTDAEAGAALARAGVLVAALVCGAFDAVLLLPTPAFLVGLALGALAPSGLSAPRGGAGIDAASHRAAVARGPRGQPVRPPERRACGGDGRAGAHRPAPSRSRSRPSSTPATTACAWRPPSGTAPPATAPPPPSRPARRSACCPTPTRRASSCAAAASANTLAQAIRKATALAVPEDDLARRRASRTTPVSAARCPRKATRIHACGSPLPSRSTYHSFVWPYPLTKVQKCSQPSSSSARISSGSDEMQRPILALLGPSRSPAVRAREAKWHLSRRFRSFQMPASSRRTRPAGGHVWSRPGALRATEPLSLSSPPRAASPARGCCTGRICG